MLNGRHTQKRVYLSLFSVKDVVKEYWLSNIGYYNVGCKKIVKRWFVLNSTVFQCSLDYVYRTLVDEHEPNETGCKLLMTWKNTAVVVGLVPTAKIMVFLSTNICVAIFHDCMKSALHSSDYANIHTK